MESPIWKVVEWSECIYTTDQYVGNNGGRTHQVGHQQEEEIEKARLQKFQIEFVLLQLEAEAIAELTFWKVDILIFILVMLCSYPLG